MSSDDDELVRRSLAGERDAFGRLVAKHHRLVYAVALSNAHDASQAEEVAQEAFVEAWRDLPRLRDPARFSSWLVGIARNVARSWRRHLARRRRRETLARPALERVEPTPLDHALERETSALLRAAITEIPSAYREVLVLFYVDGRSVEDVARGLGISENLARQRLARGRRALRGALETRVEEALGEVRPGKGFVATVMIAVGAATAREASAASLTGKAWLAMKTTKVVTLGIAVVVAAGIVWYTRPAPTPPRHEAPPAAATSAAVPVGVRAATEPVHAPAVHKLASAEQRQPLVEAIHAAQQHRAKIVPPPSVHPHADDADADPDEDPDRTYIRDAMKALLPMIRDCYDQAKARKPELAGTLVVHFVIEGEPDIGGVVTQSAIDRAKSGIDDAELGECIEQTMFALEIDPPAAGMKVDVTFPFTFGAKR